MVEAVSHHSAAAQAAIGFVIDRCEGGAELVTDSGGLTRFGISQRAYPGLDIASLTREKAIALFASDYWAPIWGDELEPGLALHVFDSAVNQGTVEAVLLLQRVLSVKDDGRMGAATLGASRRFLPISELRVQFNALRIATYYDLAGRKPTYTKYVRGWIARACRVADEAGRIGR